MANYFESIKELNCKQRKVLGFDDSAVVVAGPGSGKTRVLSIKVCQLLRDIIPAPQGIVCLTYTRAMAQELEHRIHSIGVEERPNIVIDTIHSFCLSQVIKPFANLFDLEIPYPIRIAPQNTWDECLDIARKQVQNRNFDPENDRQFKTKLIKYHLLHIDKPFDSWGNPQYAKLVECHYSLLEGKGFIDFDLVIKYALKLISENLIVRQFLETKFPWFAVDEFQDLGYPLFRIISEMLDQTSIKTFAIGDPDQSIYGFTGTDPIYLEKLKNRLDVPNYLELEQNYRSSKNIVQVCKSILKPRCNYFSDTESNEGLCLRSYKIDDLSKTTDVILELIKTYSEECGIPLHEIAVLHPWRQSRDSTEGIQIIAESLDAIKVDYDLDQHPFYDRSKRLIQWLEKMAVWSLFGWETTVEKRIKQKCDFEEIQRYWLMLNKTSLNRAIDNRTDLRVMLTRTLWEVRGKNLPFHIWLSHVQYKLGLEQLLTNFKNEHPDEVIAFENLVNVSTQATKLRDWLIDQFAHTKSSIQLTTLHSSKGQEFDAVIIAGFERIFPNIEGQRLLYVGATRAKKQLSIIYRQGIWPNNKYAEGLNNTFQDARFYKHLIS